MKTNYFTDTMTQTLEAMALLQRISIEESAGIIELGASLKNMPQPRV